MLAHGGVGRMAPLVMLVCRSASYIMPRHAEARISAGYRHNIDAVTAHFFIADHHQRISIDEQEGYFY